MTVMIKTTAGDDLHKLYDVQCVHQSSDELTIVMSKGMSDLVLPLDGIASILILP